MNICFCTIRFISREVKFFYEDFRQKTALERKFQTLVSDPPHYDAVQTASHQPDDWLHSDLASSHAVRGLSDLSGKVRGKLRLFAILSSAYPASSD